MRARLSISSSHKICVISINHRKRHQTQWRLMLSESLTGMDVRDTWPIGRVDSHGSQ